MKIDNRRIAFLACLYMASFVCGSPQAYSWGTNAHERMTDAACDALPQEIKGFFAARRNKLAFHSNDPDRWKKDDPNERPRHYIDIDMYGNYPFEELPRNYNEAIEKYGVETVTERGLAPWRIEEYSNELSETMRFGNLERIVQVAAALAHYVEDIHMPLHVVENHDGQFTNQKGVHGRFEIDMVDAYASQIQLEPDEAEEIEDPLEHAFDIILDSYVYAENLLRSDRRAKSGETDYGEVYLEKLFRFGGWIAEKRMSDASTATASYWYTAWLRAGKPALITPNSIAVNVVPEGRSRARELGIYIGIYETGRNNAITDVAGVKVGHATLNYGDSVRTGVTAVIPHDDIWTKKLYGASHIINGNGEATGTAWINEAGWIESPIMLTNTLSIGPVHNGVVQYMIKRYPKNHIILPIVAECYDGGLNDISGLNVTAAHAIEAIEYATDGPVPEGCVGAGTGMRCYGFKAGIGTASRVLPADNGGYTIGVLVNSNGGRRAQLRIDGVPVGQEITDFQPEWGQDGSFIIVIATDAPLTHRQLSHLAKRGAFGLTRTGTPSTVSSGEFVIAFSTANIIPRRTESGTFPVVMLANHAMNTLYQAAIEATEEAIINSMTAAVTTVGRNGNTIHAIPLDRLQAAMKKYGHLTQESND